MPLSDQVGSYWSKAAQVDVVGINSMEKVLILGECKWSAKQMGAEVLEALVTKTGEVVPKQGQWTVHYLGMARGGWTAEARTWITRRLPAGSNWVGGSVSLQDLDGVDADLALGVTSQLASADSDDLQKKRS